MLHSRPTCVVDTPHVEKLRSHTVKILDRQPEGKGGHGRCKDRWVKVKVKFSLEQAMKAQRGIRVIALLFL